MPWRLWRQRLVEEQESNRIFGLNRILPKEARRIKETYATAGVNIALAAKAKELISKHARSTLRPEVLSGVGFFGGLFEFKGYQHPVLVSSVDGVGTIIEELEVMICGCKPIFGKLNSNEWFLHVRAKKIKWGNGKGAAVVGGIDL